MQMQNDECERVDVDTTTCGRYAIARCVMRGARGMGGMSRMFSTHPPIEERIRRIDALERTVYSPVAQGEAAAPDDAESDGGTSVVR